jgi:hypothetical protein
MGSGDSWTRNLHLLVYPLDVCFFVSQPLQPVLGDSLPLPVLQILSIPLINARVPARPSTQSRYEEDSTIIQG